MITDREEHGATGASGTGTCPAGCHRGEIDGLRALAIAAVVIFHADLGLPGGFLGVDAFFVISGYLITSLIWRDLRAGRFSCRRFWERRWRRIVPAYQTMIAAVLVVGWWLLPGGDFRSLGRAAFAHALFAGNLRAALGVDYFGEAAWSDPLLHAWSLGVEGQFYLAIPLLLGAVAGMTRGRRRAAIALLTLAGLVGWAVSHRLTIRSPAAGFYLLSARSWEFLLGAVVALARDCPWRYGKRYLREIASLAGLTGVAIAVTIASAALPVPHATALLCCAGIALLLWSNEPGPGGRLPTLTARICALRPVALCGRMSYSLYLWHWPALVFLRQLHPAPPWPARLLAVMVAAGIAWLSWLAVERPIRSRRFLAAPRTLVATTLVGMLLVLLVSLLGTHLGRPVVRSLHRSVPVSGGVDPATAGHDLPFTRVISPAEVLAGDLIRLGATGPDVPPTVLVWGDSHAQVALPAVHRYLAERDIVGEAVVQHATPPMIGWYTLKRHGLNARALAWGDAVLAHIVARSIREVLLIARWYEYREARGGAGCEDMTFDQALVTTVRRLRRAGARSWIMLAVPAHPADVVRAASRCGGDPEQIAALCARAPASELPPWPPALVRELRAAGALLIDPKPAFRDPATGRYRVWGTGGALYRDGHHLSVLGAHEVLLPFLREAVTID